jgi:hypothetical protein
MMETMNRVTVYGLVEKPRLTTVERPSLERNEQRITQVDEVAPGVRSSYDVTHSMKGSI